MLESGSTKIAVKGLVTVWLASELPTRTALSPGIGPCRRLDGQIGDIGILLKSRSSGRGL